MANAACLILIANVQLSQGNGANYENLRYKIGYKTVWGNFYRVFISACDILSKKIVN